MNSQTFHREFDLDDQDQSTFTIRPNDIISYVVHLERERNASWWSYLSNFGYEREMWRISVPSFCEIQKTIQNQDVLEVFIRTEPSQRGGDEIEKTIDLPIQKIVFHLTGKFTYDGK